MSDFYPTLPSGDLLLCAKRLFVEDNLVLMPCVPSWLQIDVAMPDFRGAIGKICELLHTLLVVQKMQRGQKPHGTGDYLGPGHVGDEKAPAIDGRGKLAERV